MQELPVSTKIKILILFPILCFCYILYYITPQKRVIKEDILRYTSTNKSFKWYKLFIVLARFKEARSVFYTRIGIPSHLCKLFLPSISSCDLGGLRNVKSGFKLIHGYGVVISPYAIIGSQCTVLQNVTIGDKEGTGSPKIGDNVIIGAGAIIIGPITIGNNVKIGAGAVVVSDIPANSIVVGPKAQVISKKSL